MTLYILCEGQSEETFIKQVLKPYFQHLYLDIIPTVTKTSQGHKGGGLKNQRIRKEICNLLRHQEAFVSTFFDYYALPQDFPQYSNQEQANDIYQKISILEQGFCEDINCERFFPHIQPHEFETLLFSNINKIIEADASWNESHLRQLQSIIQEFDNIEHINNSPQTSPSHRLLTIFPTYNKIRHGKIISEKTTITSIREKCQHFNEWCKRISNLNQL